MSGGSRLPASTEPRDAVAAPQPRHVMDDVERMVSRVLTAGIALSVVLMAIGLVLGVLAGDGVSRGVVALADLPRELAALDPAAYLSAGLIALIATPFVRVAGSIVAFARERDYRYVLVTAIVLAVMCVSVVVGKA